jgi:AcrR family transcriptional regulator
MSSAAQVPPSDPLYSPYQPGDLRQAFIDAAVVMVRERGEERFSLNELARKLGVSAGAAYRHFANKEALLSTVCASGYVQLADALRVPLDEDLPAADRVMELALRYTRFAVANPDLFAMMFGTRTLNVEAVGEKTFAPLVEATRAAQESGALPAGDASVVSAAVWMTLHGLTTLHLNGRLATLGLDDDPDLLVRRYMSVTFPELGN